MNGAGVRSEPEYASLVDEVVRRTLAAADAERAVRERGAAITADLEGVASVTLIAVGKAAAGMARGAMPLLGERVSAGVVVIPRGASGRAADPGPLPRGVEVCIADHPTPGSGSFRAGERVEALVAQASRLCPGARTNPAIPSDPARPKRPTQAGRLCHHVHAVVLLISGGASAMMAAPREGVTLADLGAVADALMRSGAGIDELNTVRRRLDRLKGGGLARLAAPARVFTYAISDVLGDDLRTIGSGPGVCDATTDADALGVLESRSALGASPAATAVLRAGAKNPPPIAPPLGASAARVLLNNGACLEWLREQLTDLGDVVEVRAGVRGEARDAAGALVHRLAQIGADSAARPGPRPRLVLWGGETTVTVRGTGLGGRNQEFALAGAIAAAEFARARSANGAAWLVIASFGTDGVDGPTDAAGAFVTDRTVAAGRALGLDPAAALGANDSHTFFAALEAGGVRALVRTGPTGTNVNDVMLGAIWT